jgi:hypothetical protein
MAKLIGGRPGPGTRTGAPNAAQLTGRFLEILADDFEANGKDAVERAREKDPIGYLRAIAALLPKDMTIDKPTDGLSDDELATVIGAIRELHAALQEAANQHSGARAGRKTRRAGGGAQPGARNGKGGRHPVGSAVAAKGAHGSGTGAGEAREPQSAGGLQPL